MARADKATAVADIAEQFSGSTATLITEYRGLTVANLAELRRSLAGSATYTVAKNTLIKRAASEAGVEGLDELFAGPTAIAFVRGEPVDAAKAIKTFAKEHKALVIKGGYMDGQRVVRRRGRAHRRPGVPRGPAGQAGRRDEGQPRESGRPVQRARLAGGQARGRAAGEAGRRRARGCGARRSSCPEPQKLPQKQPQKLPPRQPQNQPRKHPPRPRPKPNKTNPQTRKIRKDPHHGKDVYRRTA